MSETCAFVSETCAFVSEMPPLVASCLLHAGFLNDMSLARFCRSSSESRDLVVTVCKPKKKRRIPKTTCLNCDKKRSVRRRRRSAGDPKQWCCQCREIKRKPGITKTRAVRLGFPEVALRGAIWTRRGASHVYGLRGLLTFCYANRRECSAEISRRRTRGKILGDLVMSVAACIANGDPLPPIEVSTANWILAELDSCRIGFLPFVPSSGI